MISKSTRTRTRTILALITTISIAGAYLALIVAPAVALPAIVVPLFFLPPLAPFFVVLYLSFMVSVWPLISLGIRSTVALMNWCESLFPA